MKSNQFGRSMIEMLGVIAIVCALTIGGLAGYSKVMMQYRVGHAMEQISEMTARLSLVGEQSSSYEGLSNNVAIKMKAVPGDMVTQGSDTLSTPFSGDVMIESANLLASSGDDSADLAFTITYSGLSAAECMRFATQEWKSGQNGAFLGVGFATSPALKETLVNGIYLNCNTASTVAEGGGAYAIGCGDGVELSMDDATTGCGCDDGNCIMVIKYY